MGACYGTQTDPEVWDADVLSCVCDAWLNSDRSEMLDFRQPQPSVAYGSANIGFVWLRNGSTACALLDETTKRLGTKWGDGPDQEYFNAALCGVASTPKAQTMAVAGHALSEAWEREHRVFMLALANARVISCAVTTIGMGNAQFAEMLGKRKPIKVHTSPSVLHTYWNALEPQLWLKEAYFEVMGAWHNCSEDTWRLEPRAVIKLPQEQQVRPGYMRDTSKIRAFASRGCGHHRKRAHRLSFAVVALLLVLLAVVPLVLWGFFLRAKIYRLRV